MTKRMIFDGPTCTVACNKTRRFNINNQKISCGVFILSGTKIINKHGLDELKICHKFQH